MIKKVKLKNSMRRTVQNVSESANKKIVSRSPLTEWCNYFCLTMRQPALCTALGRDVKAASKPVRSWSTRVVRGKHCTTGYAPPPAGPVARCTVSRDEAFIETTSSSDYVILSVPAGFFNVIQPKCRTNIAVTPLHYSPVANRY